jgi:tRNA dimethylallyltransferase
MHNQVIFLLGPTATGKTALACRLSELFRLDIVSVDSALVYRDMNIGTAKPDAATLARYPHQLIDLITPVEAYSAAQFRHDVLAAIAASHVRGRTPMLVGGTMMYVKALLDGLSTLPVANPSIRGAIEAKAAESGWPSLHLQLADVDPITAARLSPNDSQRIQRALEVYEITGMAMSALQTRHEVTSPFPYATTIFALLPSQRDVLHARIAARFDAMINAGLVDELKSLRLRYPLHAEMPSMRCVGYRQAWQFLEGAINAKQFRDQGVIATRQLAKRQMTWLRSMPSVETFDCLDANVESKIAACIQANLAR